MSEYCFLGKPLEKVLGVECSTVHNFFFYLKHGYQKEKQTLLLAEVQVSKCNNMLIRKIIIFYLVRWNMSASKSRRSQIDEVQGRNMGPQAGSSREENVQSSDSDEVLSIV